MMRVAAFVAMATIVVAQPDRAEARSEFLSEFNERYETTGSRLDDCAVCHGGVKAQRNSYGLDMEAVLSAGLTPRASLMAIESRDSDADGYLNIDEIGANTLPGDPDDMPVSVDCHDADADGYFVEGGACGPPDCDDSDTFINPGATELCTNGIDDDCDGLVDARDPDATLCPSECTDADDDGYSVEGNACGAVDCDDVNGDVSPGSIEECFNGIDDDCDALVDDADSDCGACIPTADAEEGGSCHNGFDDDCDGFIDDEDADCGDGEDAAPEVCDDGIDNDRDGWTDCADVEDCGEDPIC